MRLPGAALVAGDGHRQRRGDAAHRLGPESQSRIGPLADNESMAAMWRQTGNAMERADLGGWLPLVAGLLLIALAVLLPAWHDLQDARRQQAQLTTTLAAHTNQLHRYQQLIVSVRNDDPMILQRLAWNELRLKPVGAEVIGEPPADRRMQAVHQRWVQQAAPLPPRPAPKRDTKLDRLIAGPTRPVVLLAGAMLVGFGLLTSFRGSTSD